MSGKILVAYASGSGSTAEVAQTVGSIMAEHGTEVDVRRMQDVSDLSAYGAVVVGSPIRGQHWLPEAMDFLRKHQAVLNRVPVAMFTLCMTLAMKDGEKYRPGVAEWLAPPRALARPVSEGIFAGVLDSSKISSLKDRLSFRVSVAFGIWKEGDHRDWNAIRGWAAEARRALNEKRAAAYN